jgi:hypothetical protein
MTAEREEAVSPLGEPSELVAPLEGGIGHAGVVKGSGIRSISGFSLIDDVRSGDFGGLVAPFPQDKQKQQKPKKGHCACDCYCACGCDCGCECGCGCNCDGQCKNQCDSVGCATDKEDMKQVTHKNLNIHIDTNGTNSSFQGNFSNSLQRKSKNGHVSSNDTKQESNNKGSGFAGGVRLQRFAEPKKTPKPKK